MTDQKKTNDASSSPQLVRVKFVYPRNGEVWVGRDPLSFLHIPIKSKFDRRRTNETYMLPAGMQLSVADGVELQTFVVTPDVENEYQMKRARISGGVIRVLSESEEDSKSA